MMSLDFTQNYFELLSLPVQFSLDNGRLAHNFRALQGQYHPDRFVNASDQQRRFAVQSTAHINTANDALKSPRLRAKYLLELQQIDFSETDTTQDMPFLMHQMEIRERLEQAATASDLDQIDIIETQVKHDQQALEESFQQHWQADHLGQAKDIVLKMKFYERIADEVKRLQEKLEDEMFA
jgi:molecular chaperone HscB